LPPRSASRRSCRSAFIWSSASINRERRASLDRLTDDFGIAIALVAITLLPLGLRAASVVMISIPLSLAIGLSALYFLGFSLNQISIAGFVVALGLLVDDSIVVVENIARFLREGHSRMQAAILATRQIFEAIVGCTATIMFAFLPLMMIGGTSGQFIRVLPTAVLVTVGASLLIALTIIPFLASRVLKEREDAHGNRLLQWITGAIHRFYQPILHRALARPKLTVWVSLAGCVVVMLGVGGLIGFSLFPKADTPHFLVTVETPDGSSLAETDRALHFVESKLKALPNLDSYFANLGHGNPRIYYNETGNEGDSSYADVFVKLSKYSPNDTPRRARRAAPRAAEISERAHSRARVSQRSADHCADCSSRHRAGSGSTRCARPRRSRRSSRRRRVRATSRTRCACGART
jgi:multidrug efflux pump subunit AcrB